MGNRGAHFGRRADIVDDLVGRAAMRGQPRRALWSARGDGAKVSVFDRFGVQSTAPPHAYASSAAAAFLAAVSSALRRISSAKRGI